MSLPYYVTCSKCGTRYACLIEAGGCCPSCGTFNNKYTVVANGIATLLKFLFGVK